MADTKCCAKCSQQFPASALVQKSTNYHLCPPCNRLSAYLARLELPSAFHTLSDTELASFYAGARETVQATGNGRLKFEVVKATVQKSLEQVFTARETQSVGSDQVPLSVWAARGWDVAVVVAGGTKHKDEKLGEVWSLPIRSETSEKVRECVQRMTSSITFKPKTNKRKLQDVKAQETPAGTLAIDNLQTYEDVLEEDDQETQPQKKTKLTPEEKQAAKEQKKLRAVCSKLATKSVKELTTLLLRLGAEDPRAELSRRYLQEATAFLQKSETAPLLSYTSLDLDSQVTVLKTCVQPPKQARRPKAGSKQADAEAKEEVSTEKKEEELPAAEAKP